MSTKVESVLIILTKDTLISKTDYTDTDVYFKFLHIKKIIIERIIRDIKNIIKYLKSILTPFVNSIILQIDYKLTTIK